MTFLTNEELLEAIKDYKPEVKDLYQQAVESNKCVFRKKYDSKSADINIYYKDDELREGFKDLKPDVYGLYIHIFEQKEVWVYIALDDYRDWLNLDGFELGTSLNDIVNKAKIEAQTCNYCHKKVGYKDIHQVSFAGKSCTACLSAARKKDEYPGWYN